MVWLLCNFYHKPLRTWIETDVNKFPILNYHSKKFLKLCQTSFSGIVHSGEEMYFRLSSSSLLVKHVLIPDEDCIPGHAHLHSWWGYTFLVRDCSLFIGSTGPVFQGTGQGLLLMLPNMGHKDFLRFMVRDMNFFLGKKISQTIFVWYLRVVTPIDWDTRCAIFEGTFLAGK